MSAWDEVAASAAAAIHGAFASTVIYAPKSGSQISLTAVRSDEAAGNFMGAGATMRTVSWEVRQSDVAAPSKGDAILADDIEWRVIDITRRDDVGAWVLIVETDMIGERVGG